MSIYVCVCVCVCARARACVCACEVLVSPWSLRNTRWCTGPSGPHPEDRRHERPAEGPEGTPSIQPGSRAAFWRRSPSSDRLLSWKCGWKDFHFDFPPSLAVDEHRARRRAAHTQSDPVCTPGFIVLEGRELCLNVGHYEIFIACVAWRLVTGIIGTGLYEKQGYEI